MWVSGHVDAIITARTFAERDVGRGRWCGSPGFTLCGATGAGSRAGTAGARMGQPTCRVRRVGLAEGAQERGSESDRPLGQSYVSCESRQG